VRADTAARNREGARVRNEELLRLLPALAAAPDAWKNAVTTARRTQALDFDPRSGDSTFADDPVHTFNVSFEALPRLERRDHRRDRLMIPRETCWASGAQAHASQAAACFLGQPFHTDAATRSTVPK
jgi:hypothetical protein